MVKFVCVCALTGDAQRDALELAQARQVGAARAHAAVLAALLVQRLLDACNTRPSARGPARPGPARRPGPGADRIPEQNKDNKEMRMLSP